MAYDGMILKKLCFSDTYFVNLTDVKISPLAYNERSRKEIDLISGHRHKKSEIYKF